MKFGNFTLSGAVLADADSIVLSPSGTRTAAGAELTLLNGSTTTNAIDAGPNGITSGTNKETGAQSPGFFTISTVDGTISNVYVSFANAAGAIVDTVHPNNYVELADLTTSTHKFKVSDFTFESDNTAAAGSSGSGYTQAAASVTDAYGTKVACATSCTIRVGATLKTEADTYPVDSYHGTYFVMVSY